mgnify:CR=1 FL=1
MEQQVGLIKNKVGQNKVICGLSGGVDSSVVAALINKAIGYRMHAVLVDHGLMRENEAEECRKFLKNGLSIEINLYDESEVFFLKLYLFRQL